MPAHLWSDRLAVGTERVAIAVYVAPRSIFAALDSHRSLRRSRRCSGRDLLLERCAHAALAQPLSPHARRLAAAA